VGGVGRQNSKKNWVPKGKGHYPKGGATSSSSEMRGKKQKHVHQKTKFGGKKTFRKMEKTGEGKQEFPPGQVSGQKGLKKEMKTGKKLNWKRCTSTATPRGLEVSRFLLMFSNFGKTKEKKKARGQKKKPKRSTPKDTGRWIGGDGRGSGRNRKNALNKKKRKRERCLDLGGKKRN